VMSFRGLTGRAKITSPRGKLTKLACHLNKEVDKAEQLTYLSIKIASNKEATSVGIFFVISWIKS
jgi:hypothetical protein